MVAQDLTASITPTTTWSSVASSTTQIVYAPAPQVTEVKFSETAATILIHFDVEVEFVSADETCYDFFTSQTAAMLGSDPECFLSHTQELQIILGVGANISVGDDLVFKDRVFKTRLEEYSRFLSGSFSVQAPDPPLKPTPVITGRQW